MKISDYKDLIGGDKGYETISRFFKEVKDYLNDKGKVLILFSSLTSLFVHMVGFSYPLSNLSVAKV